MRNLRNIDKMTRDEYYFSYLREMRENYKGWDGIRRSPYDFDHTANFPMSDGESNLWGDFRSNGVHMYYQFPIGKYYADFCDPHHGLVVEVDGKVHYGKEGADKIREDYIKSIGFDVLRISGRDTYDRDEEIENGYGERYTVKVCDGFDKIIAWYHKRGIEMPANPNSTPPMPWVLFKAWNDSIGHKTSKKIYDLGIEKKNYQDEVLDSRKQKGEFVNLYSFSDMLDAMVMADDKYDPLIRAEKEALSTPPYRKPHPLPVRMKEYEQLP